jgi:opine dehydrogenase
VKIAVIGGGHGAFAAAASLSESGHEVRLWRRNRAAFEPLLEAGSMTLLDTRGTREISLQRVTTVLSDAVRGAELVVIPLPATVHESLAPQLAPLLEDGQVVFLTPGTFGSYVFARALATCANDANVSFAETGTLPYLARKRGPRSIAISAYGTRLPTGVFPACNAAHAFEVLRAAYPAVEPLDDALNGALMNAGPIIHPPLILMNAGPLEHFERWDIHNEGTQSSIRRVTDVLDAERIAVREALGYGAPHFPLADYYDDARDEWMYGKATHEKLTDSGDWREHIDLKSHRYMLEDVEQGLAFLVSCADYAHVAVPVAAGLLAMGSAVVGRDFRRSGRTLENLGLADLERGELQCVLTRGRRNAA